MQELLTDSKDTVTHSHIAVFHVSIVIFNRFWGSPDNLSRFSFDFSLDNPASLACLEETARQIPLSCHCDVMTLRSAIDKVDSLVYDNAPWQL